MRLLNADKLLRRVQNVATEHWKMKLVASAETIMNQFIDFVKQTPTVNAVPIDAEFGLILNCAVRYAIGRMTYIPSSVIQYILPLIDKLDSKTLDVFIQDIERYKKDVDRGIGAWGMDSDKKDWLLFLEYCKKEINSREKQ